MQLEKIIIQLTEKDYLLFSNQLKENKADKFYYLLSSYREQILSEPELLKRLEIKKSAFYTLKSRLFDKVQEFLYQNTSDTRIELLQNVANIEHLIYKTPRETAIGILKKLEIELIEHDMPNELIDVYKALKKLHINSSKYFEYSQLYNKYVAFYLAQDKAAETLSLFCKTQSEYFLTRKIELLDYLILYKKEIQNICRLYKSHHLQLFKNILSLHFALFSPIPDEMKGDSTIEEMLNESIEIIDRHPEDRIYKHIADIIDFLNFEYYHQLNLHKNADKYFEKIRHKTSALLLFNHFSFVSHFLYSKIEFFLVDQKEAELINEEEIGFHEPHLEDTTDYIIFNCYKAAAEFYASRFSASLQTLNKLLNEISFKNMPYPEIEIKSMLALLYIISAKREQSEAYIRSISRKIADEKNDEKYAAASAFLKILKTASSVKTSGKYKKLVEQNNYFNSINNGNYSFIKYLILDNNCLQLLARS
ncbi:MAG: hypothetical protein ACXVDZ_04765 [Bacteroidia bacterium]